MMDFLKRMEKAQIRLCGSAADLGLHCRLMPEIKFLQWAIQMTFLSSFFSILII